MIITSAMMHALRPAILPLLLLLIAGHSVAHTPPNCNEALSSALAPASRWAKVFEKKHQNDPFVSVKKSTLTDPPLPIEPLSLAAQDEQLSRIVKDLEMWMVSPRDFDERFMQAHGRSSSPGEMVIYFEERLLLIEAALDELSWRTKISDPVLYEKLQISWRDWQRQISTNTKRLTLVTEPEKIKGLSKELFNLEIGFLAEVRGALIFGQIEHVGSLLLGHDLVKYNTLKSIQSLKDQALKNPQVLLDTIKKYPQLFKPVFRIEGQIRERVPVDEYFKFFSKQDNVSRYLKEIQEWILQKEADLIRVNPDGTLGWIEIKCLRNEESINNITEEYHGKKSRLNQLKEDLQIIDFIGMSKKIRLQYYSTSGVSPEVRTLLEEVLRVEVL